MGYVRTLIVDDHEDSRFTTKVETLTDPAATFTRATQALRLEAAPGEANGNAERGLGAPLRAGFLLRVG